MNDKTRANPAAESQTNMPVVVVLNRDLFFGVTIGNTLRALGYRVAIVPTTAKLADLLEQRDPDQVLAIVDLNAGVDWGRIATLTGPDGPGVPILVFGSHLDVEGRRAAKTAGAVRVLSNGDFHKDIGGFVRRYQRG